MRARSTETFLFLGTRVSQVREKLGEEEPVAIERRVGEKATAS